ncbi:aminotransferase class IV [Streptomyces chumphonensis]|uniref:aminotransferase class IV n=1 Tax=Streptomyces chumphonensis TaxID=1214925 RepID=UPI002964938C|nr:aminotransferase class IV [Streptomyces chumphonensis]
MPHERHPPAVEHLGEVAKTYYLRQAAAQGRDDAAFVDGRGRLGEATICNLAFWDGTSVVWPRAPKLDGTTMGRRAPPTGSDGRPPAGRGRHPPRPGRALRRRREELLDPRRDRAGDRLRTVARGTRPPRAAPPRLPRGTGHRAVAPTAARRPCAARTRGRRTTPTRGPVP